MLNRHVSRGLHGYSHENPVKMSIEQQHAILDKTYKDLTKFCGKAPRGNVRIFGFEIPSSNLEACFRIVCCRDRFQGLT